MKRQETDMHSTITPPALEHAAPSLRMLMKTRDAAIDRFIGLGPPDLVVVNRQGIVRGWLGGVTKLPPVAYAHWLLGGDNSSAAACSAYFYSLISGRDVLTPSMRSTSSASAAAVALSSSATGVGQIVTGGTYCTFDAFTGCDLRIEITLGGDGKPGVTAHAVHPSKRGGAAGDGVSALTTSAVTAPMWSRAFLSGVFRALSAQTAPRPRRIAGLRCIDSLR